MAANRSERSEEFLRRSLKVSPGGAQTRSKRHQTFPDNFPVGLIGGSGSRVYDLAHERYTDWICGLGAVSLGYDYDFPGALPLHASYSLPHVLEVETAELLLDTLNAHGLPHAEQVRWVKTGSEATVGAMMIARRHTKRDIVLSIGYHGWYEAHQDSVVWNHVYDCPWGDPDILSPRAGWSEVAGVLLEACRDSEPPPGYLQGIRDLCIKHGTLLIMDECVTGFRWAIGGASEYFGIEPDLAVFGKGMANGYPLACIVGPRDLMSYAVDVSGTYGGEVVSLAACKATLEVYRKEPVIQHMWDVGGKWIASGQAIGYPCHPRLKGTKEEVFEKVRTLASGGHLVHPAGFNISYSHTTQDVLSALQVLEK